MTQKAVTKAANEIADRFQHSLIDFKDDASKIVEKRADMLAKMVKKNPLASVAIGLGVGYLFARLLHRS